MSQNNDYDAQGRRVYGRLDDNNSNTNYSDNSGDAYRGRNDNTGSSGYTRRRDDYRDERPRTYTMRQRLYNNGEDYDIQDDRARRMFYVDGKQLNSKGFLSLFDDGGRELYRIQYRNNRGDDYVEISDERSNVGATLRRASNGPRDHFEVQLDRNNRLLVEGNLNTPDYRIREDMPNGRDLATVAAQNRRNDSYIVTIEGHEDDAMLLALTVAVEILAHAS